MLYPCGILRDFLRGISKQLISNQHQKNAGLRAKSRANDCVRVRVRTVRMTACEIPQKSRVIPLPRPAQHKEQGPKDHKFLVFNYPVTHFV